MAANVSRLDPTERTIMGKRDDLIAKYAKDLEEKCGMKPDMKLLTAVTLACGPSI